MAADIAAASCGILVLILVWAGLTGILIGVGVTVKDPAPLMHSDRHVTSVVIAHRNPDTGTRHERP